MNEFETKLNNFIKQHNENIDNKVLDKIEYKVNSRDYIHEVFDPIYSDLLDYLPKYNFMRYRDYTCYEQYYKDYTQRELDYWDTCTKYYKELANIYPDFSNVPEFEPIETLLKFYKFNHDLTPKRYLDKFFFKVLADLFTATLLESIGCPELIGEFNSSKQYNKAYILVANSIMKFMFIDLYGITGIISKSLTITHHHFENLKSRLSTALQKGIIPFKLITIDNLEPMKVTRR